MSVPNAFLALDDCDIFLATAADEGCNNDYYSEDTSTSTDSTCWFDVEIPCPRIRNRNVPTNDDDANNSNNTHDANANINNNTKDEGNRHQDGDCCSWCRLFLAKIPSPGETTIEQQRLEITTTGMHSSNCSNDNNNGYENDGIRGWSDGGRRQHDNNNNNDNDNCCDLRYDGTIQDTKCYRCSSSSGSRHDKNNQQRQRSDAALVVGLALTSRDYEHIDIQSIKVGLCCNNTNNNQTKNSIPSSSYKDDGCISVATRSTDPSSCYNNNSNNKHHQRYYYRKQKACLLIAFTCREISGQQQQCRHRQQQRSSLLDQPFGRQRRLFFADSTKSLPAATQLLMSIMSSDWREYDARLAGFRLPLSLHSHSSWWSSSSSLGEHEGRKRNSRTFNDTFYNYDDGDDSNSTTRSTGTRSRNSKNRVQQFRNSRSPAVSFFPSRMNLEDVFQRIGGVSSSSLVSDPKVRPKRKKEAQEAVAITASSQLVESKTCKTDDTGCTTSSNSNHSCGNHTIDENKTNTKVATRVTTTLALAAMPTDILCHHIGQYLRAKSLDALRCTCKHLHWTLRLVVPGLRLDLYSHQIKSLVWMRGRETKQITEDDLLEQKKQQQQRLKQYGSQKQSNTNNQPEGRTVQWIINDNRSKEGDAHRAATGGGTVVLCPRQCHGERGIFPNGDADADENCNAEAVRISQLNFCEVIHDQSKSNNEADNPLSRKVARGGLLCDDPGLGKTITVVSLILQTMGLTTKKGDSDRKSEHVQPLEHIGRLSTEREDAQIVTNDATSSDEMMDVVQPENTLSSVDERIFDAYWKEQIIPEFRCQALTKLFAIFLRSSRDINLFFDNYWLKVLEPETMDASSYPLSLKDIRRRIGKSVYSDSLRGFVSDVESCFQNAISSTASSDSIRQAATQLLVVFRSQIIEFKQNQIEVAIKSFSRASAKPDSIVAALIEKNNSENLKNSLFPSSATLLVVPAVLVDHWMEQLKLNVDVSYCTDRIPLVFEYTGSNKTELRIEETLSKCRVKKTHFAFIFVDRTATKKLPLPSFLAMFKIVITTNNRFSSEWKNGSFEDEMRRNRNQDSRSTRNIRCIDFREDLTTSEEACPLLKVNWLRMIVDEGHSMGRGRDNSSISFASWINSERRWAMTGTPTPQTSTQSGLINVFNLMQYLQHEFFTRRFDGDTIWNQLIVRSWNRGFVSSFFRLRSLLSMLMIRHVKSDISELPLPVFNINTICMGFEEVSTYNTLVCAIQSNLVITSMKGKTSGAQDSLLHKSQTRHAREAISNLRLVCAGGTQVRPTLSDEYWTEFHQDFDDCNSDPIQRKKIRDFISRATSGQRSKCDCCSVMLSTLLVFPCGHLVCTECVDSDTTSCVVCDKKFDVDAFQRLQPGFKYDWLHNVEEETKQQANGNNGKTEDDNEALLLPGGHGVLVPHNQRQRRARSRKFGDGHTCEYDPTRSDGKCILCFAEHEPCYLAGERRCCVCYRLTQNCPTSESKITHIIEKLLRLYNHQKEANASAKNGRDQAMHQETALASVRGRTPKVIVFSQFRKVLNITGDRLLRRFGSGCIAEYWGKYRKKELNKFVKDERCLCMLLGKDGSEGLDLSFVTHVIFLEQVWDKSLENQVVARAWRMGARGSVNVETLVAENSIEETMFLLEKNLDYDQEDSQGSSRTTTAGMQKFRSTAKDKKSSEYQQAKLRYLLNSLKLIVDTSSLGFGVDGAKANSNGSLGPSSKASSKRQHSETVDLAKGKRAKKLRVRFQA